MIVCKRNLTLATIWFAKKITTMPWKLNIESSWASTRIWKNYMSQLLNRTNHCEHRSRVKLKTTRVCSCLFSLLITEEIQSNPNKLMDIFITTISNYYSILSLTIIYNSILYHLYFIINFIYLILCINEIR